jgi:hypothetical protein
MTLEKVARYLRSHHLCENMTQDNGETDVDCGGECVADAGDPDNAEGKCDNVSRSSATWACAAIRPTPAST